jgi:hypothetical protein
LTIGRVLAIAVLAVSAASGQLCPPDWLPANFAQTVDGSVLCMAVYDNGTGPKLYAGGSFSGAGGAAATGLVSWDGTSWQSVGGGVVGSVNALCVHDDGTGPQLYIGGWFTAPGANIVKWDGNVFTTLGQGFNTGVQCLASYDDGTGSQLYAGGWFVSSGATALNHIARWNGTVWSAVGTGVNSGMNACGVYNGALYVGGSFTTAGGLASPRLARWNGAWQVITGGANGDINAMVTFDPGTGQQLYIGGLFTMVNGVSANRVARFDGTTWNALGTGLGSLCYGLAGYDDGTGGGPALYATGAFTTAGGNAVNRIAKFDGTNWSALGSGLNTGGSPGRSLCVYNTPYGNALFVGGGFTDVGASIPSPNVAIWGPSPPVVVTQPVATQSVNPGSPATFSVVAAGAGLTYQWRHLGQPIAGATSATHTITAAGPLNWGFYDCVITNGCGGTTTATSTLTINPAFLLTMNQPFGPLSLYINHSSPAQPGASYITTFSFDPANGAMPGQGLWSGLFVTFDEIVNQFLVGGPPFVGVFDASGQASFFLSAGQLPAFLFGQTVYAVSVTFNPANLNIINNSNVVTLFIQ